MVKPQLPVAAQEYTVKGAEAFVRYYIDAQNYAGQTADTSQLGSLAIDACEVCSGVVEDLNAMRGRGEHFEGGLWVPRAMRATQMRGKRVAFRTLIDTSQQVRYGAGRKVLQRYSGLTGAPYEFEASWESGSWRMSWMERLV